MTTVIVSDKNFDPTFKEQGTAKIDAAVREPEETGRRSRFCVAKILTMPISKGNFLNKKVGRGIGKPPKGL